MIEWIIGAAIFAVVGELFGTKRREAPPSPSILTSRPHLKSSPILPEEEKPQSDWDAARFGELSVALSWLDSPPVFPAACLTPPILSEAARYRRYLKRNLARIKTSLEDPAQFGRIDAFLDDPAAARQGAIAAHLQREFGRWEPFLDQVASRPLSPEQRQAVLSDEDATLVLAGAGSGKTSVITAKAAHLLKAGIRSADQILPLAYGKDAASEMASRMAVACDEPVKAWTFHALAYHIIGSVEGKKPPLAAHAGDQQRYLDVLRRILKQLVTSDEAVANAIIEWFTQFPIECATEWDFDTKHAWYTHVESLNLRTLQGERVRSYEEFLIANWLYRNGVEYEYEPLYEHQLQDSGKRGYTPDFRLTESGVYLEHFGVRREKVPGGRPDRLVTAPFVNREDYLASMEWKRKVHASFGTCLIETYSYEREEGRLLDALAEKVAPHVVLRPRPPETIYDRVMEMGQIDGFTQLLGTFLLKFKSGSYAIADCLAKAEKLKMGERAKAFLAVFAPVFDRYQQDLGSRIDFEDMVLRASGHVEAGRYRSPFRHILVDEFQDIAQDRARLVVALKAQHPDARVFAVGDDWQSIYRFAGADIHIMRGFGATFGGEFSGQKGVHEVVDLGRTFRSVDKIALAARRFVLQNPAQIDKTIIPAGEAKEPAVRVLWTRKAKCDDELHEALASLPAQGGADRSTSVLLLGRYRHEEPNLSLIAQRFPRLSVRFKTIHGAKGLEADHVVVLGCNDGKFGFPSGVSDDPILTLVSPEDEPFPNAEERRIMYVALTRARQTVTLLASETEPSAFVRELVADPEYGLAINSGSMPEHVPCSDCGGRLLPVPARDGKVWYRCEHRLMCNNFVPACNGCGIGIPTMSKSSGNLQCSHCGMDHHECPKCSDGWLVERHGRYGEFFSCVRFPACTGKASKHEIAEKGSRHEITPRESGIRVQSRPSSRAFVVGSNRLRMK